MWMKRKAENRADWRAATTNLWMDYLRRIYHTILGVCCECDVATQFGVCCVSWCFELMGIWKELGCTKMIFQIINKRKQESSVDSAIYRES